MLKYALLFSANIYKIGSLRKLWLHVSLSQTVSNHISSIADTHDINLRNGTVAHAQIAWLIFYYIYMYIDAAYTYIHMYCILFIYMYMCMRHFCVFLFFELLLTRVTSAKLCKCFYGIKHASQGESYLAVTVSTRTY